MFPHRNIPVLFIAILFSISSCKNDLDEAKLITSRANVNIESGKNVEINYSENGKVRIKAVAPVVTRFNNEKSHLEFSNGIKIYFYDEQHNVESMLTARYGTAVENSHEMTVSQNVEVINAKGEKLNTEELIWDETRKIIYSNAFVKITTADEILYGNGMQADQNFTNYVIRKISGKIRVNTSEVE